MILENFVKSSFCVNFAMQIINKLMTGLADCNNFFVSCERAVDPSLVGKAVVVLSNNDGCAIARSNEAKKLGVRMGQPTFELRDLIASGRLIALSGNHILYRDMSLKVHDIFRRFVPRAIDYSIDESFLDFSGVPDDALFLIGDQIRKACFEELSIPVTIGIGPTKTIAKIVTGLCKKTGQSVMIVNGVGDVMPVYRDMPVHELWGIGRRIARRLYAEGIYTVADFASRSLIWVRSKLGVNGERSWRELHGQPCIELEHVDRIMQDSVSESRTFAHDTDSFDYIRARISIYVADCARRLRAMKGQCRSISVFLRSNRFHTERGYYAPQLTVRLERATADTTTLVDIATGILKQIMIAGVKFKRAGVVLSDIVSSEAYTPSIFDMPVMDHKTGATSNNKPISETIDRINALTETSKIKLASQLTTGHPGHNDGYSSSFAAPSTITDL